MLYLPSVLKRCSACKQYRFFNEFSKSKIHKDGHDPRCRHCRKVKQQQYYDKHRVDITRKQREVYAKCPDKKRALNRQWHKKNRNKSAAAVQRYRKRHKEKSLECVRQSRIRHIDKHKAYDHRYGIENKDKIRIKTQRRQARKRHLKDTFTQADWNRGLDYFDNRCAVCNRPRGFFHTLAMDHWIPLSSPDCPGTVAANIIPLCHGDGGCNNAKGSKDPADWLIQRFGKRKARLILRRIHDYFTSL